MPILKTQRLFAGPNRFVICVMVQEGTLLMHCPNIGLVFCKFSEDTQQHAGLKMRNLMRSQTNYNLMCWPGKRHSKQFSPKGFSFLLI